MSTSQVPRHRLLRLAEVLAAILSAIAAETLLAALWADSTLTAAEGAGGHLAVVAALAAWTWSARRRRAVRMAALLCTVTALMGPLGAAGALLAFALGSGLETGRADFDRWFADLFPDETRAAAQLHYERIICGRDRLADSTAVGPFLDILAHGSVERQLAAVATMSRRFHPAFAPVLRAALQHAVPQVRVQAAAATTHIENGFAQRLARLQATLRDAPDDAAAWLALARHHEAYAATGLLDGDREAQSLGKALNAYGRCLELGGEGVEVAEGLARLLIRLGRFDEAAQVVERHPILRTRPWYAEYLFCSNRIAELENLMEVAAADGSPQVGRLWMEARP